MIFNLLTHLSLFQIAAEIKTKMQNLTDINFTIELSTVEKFVMCPYVLQCILYKSPIDTECLSLTIHGVNVCFIHHPSMSKITQLAKSLKLVNQKKKLTASYIFLHLSVNFWLKIQNMHCYRNLLTFSIFGQWALNGPANGPTVIYSKIQNRLGRAP